MNGYLLFSHGSLLCGAGQALGEHAERLRQRFGGVPVEVGYLNYSEPTAADAVGALVEAGVTQITVIPYFLVPGYFVKVSLPEKMDEVCAGYPGLSYTVAPALGTDDLLADALIASARQPKTPEVESAEVYAVAAAACRDFADCPLHETIHCPATAARMALAAA